MAVEASPDSPGVTVYFASLDSRSCNASAAGSPPHTCTIATLSSGALHEVQVFACLATGECSTSTSGQGFTLPDGTQFQIRNSSGDTNVRFILAV